MAIIRRAQSKKLHRHSLPIVLIAAVVIAVTGLYIKQISVPSLSNSVVLQSMFHRSVTLIHSPNGAIHVRYNPPNIQPKIPDASDAGEDTEEVLLFSK